MSALSAEEVEFYQKMQQDNQRLQAENALMKKELTRLRDQISNLTAKTAPLSDSAEALRGL